MTNQFIVSIPFYKFGNKINLEKVSKIIDDVLIANFRGKDVVLRGIQSGKHQISKDELINLIMETGIDKYHTANENSVIVGDIPIDLFGFRCKINRSPIVLPILEGFHKWKPKSLEQPQRQVDIWMIYDSQLLENITYTHSHYDVKVRDGFRFTNPAKKKDALLGLLIID